MAIMRSMVIPDSFRTLANSIADMFAGNPQNMWNFPLSATGQAPATHWIAAGPVPNQYEVMAPWQVWQQDQDGKWVMTDSYPGQPDQVWAACQAAQMTCTLEDIQAMYAAADITQQDPWAAMARLGLQPVQEAA